jgi:N-dimethylarginine dimethylaminohydrolase
MHVRNPVDRELAAKQWQDLFLAYRTLGQEVQLVEPRPGQPDMVFAANAGLVRGDRAVLSHFAHAERQGEEPFWWAALYDRGYKVKLLPSQLAFEGAGDAIFVGDKLFAGYGFRTDVQAHPLVGAALDVEVVSLQLIDERFYHLDTCFCPLSKEVVLFAPDAFDPDSARVIRKSVSHVIEVPLEVAEGFACNGVTIGQRLLSSDGVEALDREITAVGFKVMPLPMSEFIKGGGGVRCLSLLLD